MAVRQGVLQLRDLHEDTTGPGQGEGGDFPASHRTGKEEGGDVLS